MSDLISRQEAIDAIERNAYRHTYLEQITDIIAKLPTAEPEIIYCRDCKNHIGKRCMQANHYTSDNDCCMTVFHAERRTDARCKSMPA